MHDQIVMDGECTNAKELWIEMKRVMNNLVVEGTQVTVMDRLRKPQKTEGETELMYAGRAHLVYQTSESTVRESECVSVLLGKLSAQSRNRIIERFGAPEV